MSEQIALWEPNHPYYCQDGNYRANSRVHPEVLVHFESWADFRDQGGYFNSDPDLNLLFRWDWYRIDPEEYYLDDPGDALHLYFVLQRKADLRTVIIDNITDDDEPEIREWLTNRARTILALWAPILDSTSDRASEVNLGEGEA